MLALPAPESPSVGGQGASAPDGPPPVLSRSDARLIRQAIQGRWPIPDDMREATVAMLGAVVQNPDVFGPRAAIAAARTLLAADRLNMDDPAPPAPSIEQGDDGTPRVDFTAMTDDELDAYLERGGRR